MTAPRISVVLPTYNRAHTLERALGSVLEQTFRDLEVIVVDDASSDGTQALMERVGDPRVRYLRRLRRGGGGAARNAGIEVARAPWVAFQDSDDAWDPTKLEQQVSTIDACEDTVGFVYSGLKRSGPNSPDELVPAKGIYPEGRVYERLLLGNFVSTQTAIVRKSALRRIACFDESLPRLQDWDLFLRLAKLFEARATKQILVEAFRTPDSITSDQRAYFVAYLRILEKLGAEPVSVRKYHLRILSRAAKLQGLHGLAIELATKAVSLGVTTTDIRLLSAAMTSEATWDKALSLLKRQ